VTDHKKWYINWFDLLSTAVDCQENFKMFGGSGKKRQILINTKKCKGVEVERTNNGLRKKKSRIVGPSIKDYNCAFVLTQQKKSPIVLLKLTTEQQHRE